MNISRAAIKTLNQRQKNIANRVVFSLEKITDSIFKINGSNKTYVDIRVKAWGEEIILSAHVDNIAFKSQ